MDKVTNHQLRAIAGRISGLATLAGILEGDQWVDGIPEHLVDTRYEFPHLQLDMGSATYGRAYRLNGSGGSVYRTAHFDPMRLGSGYLGNTKREAYLALRAIEAGLSAARKAGN
jgi:hypothetical protein